MSKPIFFQCPRTWSAKRSGSSRVTENSPAERTRGEIDHRAGEGFPHHAPDEAEVVGLEAHFLATHLELLQQHGRPRLHRSPLPAQGPALALDVEGERPLSM